MRPDGICNRRCEYQNGCDSWGHCEHGCNYFTITGKSRVKAVYDKLGVKELTPEAQKLLTPKNCPCYTPTHKPIKERKQESPRKVPDDKVELLRYLHSKGLNDQEIGVGLGVSDRTVWAWRKSLGLESNHKARKKVLNGELQKC